MNSLAVLGGGLIVAIAFFDAVNTLVTTQVRKGRWWPTIAFYRITWRWWRRLGRRMSEGPVRERLLGAYGPASLLLLLIVWVGMQVFGWGWLWWGLRSEFSNIQTLTDAWYFAGVTFFTVGFGDIVPDGTFARLLVVGSAFLGVATMALVIGYLPTLYSAYSEREAELLTLDDLSGTYVTPRGLIDVYAAGGDPAPLLRRFVEWEHWVARVIQTHSAYRMLVLFRSRQLGQSWLAGLGIMSDTAVTMLAVVRTSPPEAMLLYRRCTEMLMALNREVPSLPYEPRPAELDEEAFRRRYDRLVELGFPVRPYDEAERTVAELRNAYMPQLVRLSTALLAPMKFRNPDVPYPDTLRRLTSDRTPNP